MENKEKTTTPEMPDIDVLFELADLFKVFGDSTRLRIMYTISENEMSVLNIAEALSMEQSTISPPTACVKAEQAGACSP